MKRSRVFHISPISFGPSRLHQPGFGAAIDSLQHMADLMKLRFGFGWHSIFSYAVSENGQKLLRVTQDRPATISPINVVLNPALTGAQ